MRRLTTPVVGRALAFLVTGVLALSACNGSPEPTVRTPSPKPSATTPTASASPTPPTPSESPGEAADQAFVRHYFALVDFARKTGDVEPMLEVSSPECQSCQGVADVIRGIFTAGGQYEGSYEFRILEINGSNGAMNMVARTGPFEVTGPDAKSYPVEEKFYEIELKQQGDRWIMNGYAVAE
jgi:Family of unknown function (DUF6318)